MDRQKIIDACVKSTEAINEILRLVQQDQEAEREALMAMGEPTEPPHGTLAEPR